MRNNRTRRFTYLAVLSAMAMMLNMLETALLPPFFGFFRLGIANIIALVTIRIMSAQDMIVVNCMRVVIGSLLSGRFLGSTFWIGASGVVLSSCILIVMEKGKNSLIFTSIICAIAHSVGQLLVVMAFYMQPGILAVLPYFVLVSIVTGILTAIIAQMVLKRIRPIE